MAQTINPGTIFFKDGTFLPKARCGGPSSESWRG